MCSTREPDTFNKKSPLEILPKGLLFIESYPTILRAL